MLNSLQDCYRFGAFTFYPFERILEKTTKKSERKEKLEPKASDLLLFLITNRHRVAKKEEIFASVWKDTFVEENSLTVQINQLRTALQDSSTKPKYIRTVPKQGYRFIAQVIELKPVFAILPFRYLGKIDNKESLEIGIADALISRFSSSIKRIVVRPTASIIKYAAIEYDPLQAAKDLQSDFVLTGNLRRAHDIIRASVQCIRAETREVIWSKRFPVKTSKKFLIEDTITEAIIDSLESQVSEQERKQLARRYTESNQAYQEYLIGRYFWHKSTPDAVGKSIKCFKKACNFDPSYALAYAGLGVATVLSGTFAHQTIPAYKAMKQAEEAAFKALRIDNNLPEAISVLASTKALFRWQWEDAKRDFERAIDLAPEMFTLRYWYGLCLAARGEAIEARGQLEKAIGIDPTSFLAHTLLARVLYEARQYDEAIAHCRIAIEREEHFYLSHTFLGHIHRAQGNLPEAMKELEFARLYSEDAPAILADIGYTYGISGEISKALKILQTIRDMSKKQFVAPYVFAHIYLGLGNKDNFFRWLEKSYDEKSAFMIFLATDPLYDSIREDPRFIEMVNQVGYMK